MTTVDVGADGCHKPSTCAGCGRDFVCGMSIGAERCWCAELPPLAVPPESGVGCYCPECLMNRLRPALLNTDAPSSEVT